MIDRRPYLALVGLVVFLGWVVPITHSLWIDETMTYWFVKDGIQLTVERAYSSNNFSPYYAVAWLAVQLGGQSEIALRLPSIVAMSVATLFIHRIGTRLCDEETGFLACVVFVGIYDVSFAAADARTYAFTLMAMTGAVLAALRWMDGARLWDGVALVLSAALTFYGHVLLGLGLVVPILFILQRTTQKARFVAMLAMVGLLLIPLAIQMRAFMAMGTAYMWAGTPNLPQLLAAIAPPQLFAPFIVGLVAAYVTHANVRSLWKPAKSVVAMLLVWLLFVPTVFFLVSRTTGIEVFLPRYLLSTSPAVALLLACFIRCFSPITVRRVVVGVMAGLSLTGWMLSSGFHRGEDWRRAMAVVREHTEGTNVPLVVASCFVEARSPKDLDNPLLKEALFAPLAFYPAPGKVIRMPRDLDEDHARQVFERDLAWETRFLLLTCGETETAQWMTRYATDRQFHVDPVMNFRGLELRTFWIR